MTAWSLDTYLNRFSSQRPEADPYDVDPVHSLCRKINNDLVKETRFLHLVTLRT